MLRTPLLIALLGLTAQAAEEGVKFPLRLGDDAVELTRPRKTVENGSTSVTARVFMQGWAWEYTPARLVVQARSSDKRVTVEQGRVTFEPEATDSAEAVVVRVAAPAAQVDALLDKLEWSIVSATPRCATACDLIRRDQRDGKLSHDRAYLFSRYLDNNDGRLPDAYVAFEHGGGGHGCGPVIGKPAKPSEETLALIEEAEDPFKWMPLPSSGKLRKKSAAAPKLCPRAPLEKVDPRRR